MSLSDLINPQFLISSLGLVGVLGIIFAESGLFFGFFLPGDSLLFTAGFLASQNIISLPILIIGGCVMAILGDSVGYAFGRKVGPALFSKEESLIWSKKRIDQTKSFYDKYGKKTIILARFIPIVRTFAPILAGVGNMNYKLFLTYNVIGGCLWVIALSLLGYILGNIIPDVDKYLLPIVLIIIFTSFIPPLIHIIKEKRIKK
ncbi:MAG: VTT domain-containing protein [bacterium]|nr:VTT domain-containing protein [bacterium]